MRRLYIYAMSVVLFFCFGPIASILVAIGGEIVLAIDRVGERTREAIEDARPPEYDPILGWERKDDE